MQKSRTAYGVKHVQNRGNYEGKLERKAGGTDA